MTVMVMVLWHKPNNVFLKKTCCQEGRQVMSVMTSRQAAELDHALERNGLTSNDVKEMSKGDFLTGVCQVLRNEAVIKVSRLLEQVVTTDVSGTKKFTAKNAFGPNNPAGIKFWLNENFWKHFLGKTEENISTAKLVVYTLTRASLDGPIQDKLGSHRVEIALAYLYEMISRQPKGEPKGKDRFLLTNGYANLSYICAINGKPWAVGAYWISACRKWYVRAFSIGDPIPWYGGCQVVLSSLDS